MNSSLIELKVKDVLEYEGYRQVVVAVGLGHARILRLDGKTEIIPNPINKFFTEHVPPRTDNNTDFDIFLAVNADERENELKPISMDEIDMSTPTKQKLTQVPKPKVVRGGLAHDALEAQKAEKQQSKGIFAKPAAAADGFAFPAKSEAQPVAAPVEAKPAEVTSPLPKPAAAPKAEKPAKATKPNILGHSLTAVLRGLGFRKVTTEQAVAILKSQGHTNVNHSTVTTGLSDGRAKDFKWGKPAPLAEAQYRSLIEAGVKLSAETPQPVAAAPKVEQPAPNK